MDLFGRASARHRNAAGSSEFSGDRSHHAEVRRFRARFAQGVGAKLAEVIPVGLLMQWVTEEGGRWRDRLYGPLATLKRFLEQVLSADQSGQDAVARDLSERVAVGQAPCSQRMRGAQATATRFTHASGQNRRASFGLQPGAGRDGPGRLSLARAATRIDLQGGAPVAARFRAEPASLPTRAACAPPRRSLSRDRGTAATGPT